MYRVLLRFGTALALVIVASACVHWWRTTTEDQRRVVELQQQKQQLEKVVDHLTADKRVADVLVTDQSKQGDKTITKLLFVEYDRTGKALPPRELSIEGTEAHLDATVIEFDKDFVMKDDPLRGHAICLFTRVYGDKQTPASGTAIDTPDTVPTFYQSADPKVTQFEQGLWRKFWQLEQDPALRQAAGVKVATGKSVWGPFAPELLYTVTLQSDGNLSRTAEPIRGVYGTYIQMLRQRTASTTAAE